MQNSDYIIYQGWMITTMKLSGCTLTIYALVYGYTKDGESWYSCNVRNIAEWSKTSERTVQRHLSALVSSRYLLRQSDGNGRGGKILLQANQEIIEKAQKGDILPPLKRVTNEAQKGDKISKKGDILSPTPYLRYILNNNINIILRAHTRTKKEEQEEYFIIFFFRGAADPAAETTAFMRWNESKEEWESTPLRRRYYFAGQWTISNFRPPHLRAFRDAWAGIYNYAREEGLDYGCLLDGRIALNITRDSQTGTVEAELRVTAAARDLLQAHHESTTQQYINPLIKGRVNNCRWTIIDGQ